MLKILTGGSGPSYAGWKYWPTWTKMMPFYFRCKHKDGSGPAAGNLYIARSLIYNIQQWKPDIVIAQWNFNRYDVFAGQQTFVDEVINSKSIRNFILDMPSGKLTTGSGYWCSSTDDVVPWKQYYVNNIKSDLGTHLDDLHNMITLQNICERYKIKYKFLMHDPVQHNVLQENEQTKSLYDEVDWQHFVGPSLEEIKKTHPTRHINFKFIEETGRNTSIPNPMMQYDILEKSLAPVLTSMGVEKRNNVDRIKRYCEQKQNSMWEKYKKKNA